MNIFAEVLLEVLTDHDHELSNLFSWREVIPPGTVIRLKASLSSEKSATLNAQQIDFIGEKYDFTDEDHRRLRAALVAEAVRKLVADRMAVDLAYQLGKLTLKLLLSDNADEVMEASEALLSRMRDVPEMADTARHLRGLSDGGAAVADTADPLLAAARSLGAEAASEAAILLALDNAEEALHQGALWLEVAREAGDRRARLGYVGQARALFARGEVLARQCAQVAQGSDAQQQLLASIAAATESLEEVV